MRDQVFVSYSHRDVEWLKKLETHLKPAVRAGKMVVWHDQQIKPASDWRKEIERALASAKVAVLLVSPDFLASDFITEHELPILLEARKDGVSILWLAVRYCDYKDTKIEPLQALNDPALPLAALKPTDLDRELVEICNKIKSFCPPVPIEVTTRTIGEGIDALIELMRNATVQKNVATFRAVFATSSTQIDVLGHYKDLHDSLHTLQFQCYNYIQEIARTARKRPEDSSIWENVYRYELTIENIVDDLNRFAREDQFGQALVASITGLIGNLRILFEAIRNCDAEQIETALRPIGKVLNILPPRINDRLEEAARAAHLPHLVAALTKVGENFSKFGIDSTRWDKFEKGVAALSDLNTNLISQIESHSKWQEIDRELRPIEAGIARDASELESSWPDLKEMVGELCAKNEEPWAQALREDSQKLEEAISLNDPTKIRQYFQRYRSRVGNRFYQVDFALKELCGKLHSVGDPLTTVLEMT